MRHPIRPRGRRTAGRGAAPVPTHGFRLGAVGCRVDNRQAISLASMRRGRRPSLGILALLLASSPCGRRQRQTAANRGASAAHRPHIGSTSAACERKRIRHLHAGGHWPTGSIGAVLPVADDRPCPKDEAEVDLSRNAVPANRISRAPHLRDVACPPVTDRVRLRVRRHAASVRTTSMGR